MTGRRGVQQPAQVHDPFPLKMARDVSFPLDVLTQWIGVVGKRRSGKTMFARAFIEDVLETRAAPVLVLDPTDAYRGLKSSADGTSEGYPITVFGGRHGDVPIEGTRACGEAIAQIILEQRMSAIISLRDQINAKERGELLSGLAETLYRLNRDPFFIAMDEANLLLPEAGSGGRAADALRAIVLQGGSSGFGGMIITQRPQLVEKSVLNQIDILVIMQMMGAAERKAIDNWIDKNASSEKRAEVLRSLAMLKQGEGWVWSPSTLGILKRTQFRRARTFDSSSTPKAGVHRLEPAATAQLDLSSIRDRLAETIKHAEESDPEVLHRRIKELEARSPEPEIRYITPPEVVAALEAASRILSTIGDNSRGAIEALAAAHEVATTTQRAKPAESKTTQVPPVAIAPTPDAVPSDARAARSAEAVSKAWETRREKAARRSEGVSAAWVTRRSKSSPGATDVLVDTETVHLKSGAIRMLERLASAPRSLTRRELGMFADVSGGSISDYLAALRTSGLVFEEGGRVEITESGKARVPHPPALPTYIELLDTYSRNGRVKSGAIRMLQLLIEAYPEYVPRKVVGEQARVFGGSQSDYARALQRAGLVDELPGRGMRVVEALFLARRRKRRAAP